MAMDSGPGPRVVSACASEQSMKAPKRIRLDPVKSLATTSTGTTFAPRSARY